jgi:hypothetical protein
LGEETFRHVEGDLRLIFAEVQHEVSSVGINQATE